MKALFLILVASLFASDFQNLEEDEFKIKKVLKKVAPVVIKKVVPMIPKVGPIVAPFLAEEDSDEDAQVKWGVTVTIHNEDMFTPEFDDIDDDLKIKIGKIIKKVLPIVVPKIPKIGPIIAPFLSEEDMEPEVIDYDQDQLVELVLAELAEEYEMDAGFWKSVGGFVKKVAPTVIKEVAPIVIKKLVPKIPKIGPIIAPFLGEEDSDEMIMNMTNPFARKIRMKPRRKPINGTKPYPHPRPHRKMRPYPKKVKPTVEPTTEPELDEMIMNMTNPFARKIRMKPYRKPINGTKPFPRPGPHRKVRPYPKKATPTIEPELDEINFKKLAKKVAPIVKVVGPIVIKKVVPMIPKIGPIIAPFLSEEDSDEYVPQFHLLLDEDDEEFDDEFKIKIGKAIQKVLPIVAPHIPVIGPYVTPFLSEEDAEYMEDTADVYEPAIIDAVIAELAEEYEMDEGFWKKVVTYIKPRIPQIIRTVVPLIPKVGPKIAPIIEPFLAEETDEIKCFCILAVCTC